jgi:hypothetical protein
MPNKRSGKKAPLVPPVVHPDAAGIDIGATEIFVAVPVNRDPSPVRSFQTFTQDLCSLADSYRRPFINVRTTLRDVCPMKQLAQRISILVHPFPMVALLVAVSAMHHSPFRCPEGAASDAPTAEAEMILCSRTFKRVATAAACCTCRAMVCCTATRRIVRSSGVSCRASVMSSRLVSWCSCHAFRRNGDAKAGH